VMLKIRGISNAENLLSDVNRYSHCLTRREMSGGGGLAHSDKTPTTARSTCSGRRAAPHRTARSLISRPRSDRREREGVKSSVMLDWPNSTLIVDSIDGTYVKNQIVLFYLFVIR
jgi:hypothetical protein